MSNMESTAIKLSQKEAAKCPRNLLRIPFWSKMQINLGTKKFKEENKSGGPLEYPELCHLSLYLTYHPHTLIKYILNNWKVNKLITIMSSYGLKRRGTDFRRTWDNKMIILYGLLGHNARFLRYGVIGFDLWHKVHWANDLALWV